MSACAGLPDLQRGFCPVPSLRVTERIGVGKEAQSYSREAFLRFLNESLSWKVGVANAI